MIAGRFEDFGKTIFFTEEEAGKLLERCKRYDEK